MPWLQRQKLKGIHNDVNIDIWFILHNAVHCTITYATHHGTSVLQKVWGSGGVGFVINFEFIKMQHQYPVVYATI